MWARGPAAGFLVTSALVGVTYALSQVGVVSFFPLDIAQAGIRLTPGQIATQGIEAFGHEAKMLAEATALAVVLLAGAAADSITATTASGCEIMTRWDASISVVWAWARCAM